MTNEKPQKTPQAIVLLGGEGLQPDATRLWDRILKMGNRTNMAISLLYAGIDPQENIQHERRIRSTIDAFAHLNMTANVLDTDTRNPPEIAGTVYLSGTNPFAIVESLTTSALWSAICSSNRLLIVSSGASVAVGERSFAPVAPFPAGLSDLTFHVNPGLGMIPGIMVLPYFGWLQDVVIEKIATLAADLWLVGIDDQAALIIHHNSWEVAGLGNVTIFKAGERPQRFDPGMTIPAFISHPASGEDNQ